MENKKVEIQYTVYQNRDELSESDQKLVQEAQTASEKAYAPYSRFRVGAAVLLSNNQIITANNQENIAYPEGLCAERNALFYASANFPNEKIVSIAIAGNHSLNITDFPITPCGGCRQIMAEYERKQQLKINVIMAGITGTIFIVNGIDNLLPLGFEM
jgi:cytidine deaminase